MYLDTLRSSVDNGLVSVLQYTITLPLTAFASLWVQFRTEGACPALFEKCRQGFPLKISWILQIPTRFGVDSQFEIPHFSISNAYYKMREFGCLSPDCRRLLLDLSCKNYVLPSLFLHIEEAQTTDYCTTNTCSVPTDNTLCKYSNTSWGAACQPAYPTSSIVTDADIATILTAHNDYRRKVAQDLMRLKLELSNKNI
ncbi:hypothetical protein DAPPUDRAFT_312469 [Daphnia pulex]|uniref:SCP domain-containing protein n=1 Tax=Daphnia pulex TaxID=6669 RepID=E9G0Y3_DAPPU|nr:hypothetical protein DAPPUDRAFT_312469 [Daphnia pulex]|eukprot:EFX86984.1 hypothetical protein DAPPUDRAFT_312469 [Daphnia pulex]